MKIFGIILDDGHGISTPGKRSPVFQEDTEINGVLFREGTVFTENIFNKWVVYFLKEQLKDAGVVVKETATEAVDVPLKERMIRENRFYDEFKKDGVTSLFLSIHANAHQPYHDLTWNNATGIETFYYPGSRTGKKLATCIQNASYSLALLDRGIKRAKYYVLKKSKSVAILYEGGFMTNKKELGLLASGKFQDDTAKAIVNGLMEYMLPF